MSQHGNPCPHSRTIQPSNKVYNVAHAQRVTVLKVGLKRVSPGGNVDGGLQILHKVVGLWEESNSMSLNSSLAMVMELDVDWVLMLGNGLYNRLLLFLRGKLHRRHSQECRGCNWSRGNSLEECNAVGLLQIKGYAKTLPC